MKKIRYYVGFNKNTEPFKSGYMTIFAQSVNDAKRMMNLIFVDYKKKPEVYTEAQFHRNGLEELCDAPFVNRGEYSVYKESDEQIWCNVKLNVVFHKDDGIFTASRVIAEVE